MARNRKIYVGVALLLTALVITACTPAEVQYCRSFGVEGTSEYGKCVEHYNKQSALFGADRDRCELDADLTYPRSLYDFGHFEQVHAVGGYGPHGYYGGGYRTVRVEPDFRHNAEVDALRMRIIEPCMQAKGWNSGRSWQAGRHAVSKVKQRSAPAEKLPWVR
ncbi:MAG: hypothetical protein ACOYNL_00985 [Rickettsiales bacterium]